MIPLIKIKQDMAFNEEMTYIVDILKRVAMAQFYNIHRQEKKSFISELEDFLKMIEYDKDNPPHLFLTQPAPPTGIVIVTSDEAFLGGLNTLVINTALAQRKTGEETELIVIGERGSSYMEDMKEAFTFFPGITDQIKYVEAERLANYIIHQFLSRNLCKVIFVYPRFVTFARQEPEVFNLLPCGDLLTEILTSKEEKIPPNPPLEKGGRGDLTEGEVIVEPSVHRVIDYIVRLWITQRIYEFFWNSKLAELAARTLHMEGSYRDLQDEHKKIRSVYLHCMHEMTDRANRDIFASRVLWKKL